ncbi:unnamed protein product [Trifolium pratense]|uniref:Uncharacterized protein n=1 Tax=Trifolium pratense TaxID=57577 RepID=A0ACB0L069_TRIPR|nr:unnamed protein product [Trifolium pratense]
MSAVASHCGNLQLTATNLGSSGIQLFPYWPNVATFISNGDWVVPSCITDHDPALALRIKNLSIPRIPLKDKLVWRLSLTAEQAFSLLFSSQPTCVALPSWLWTKVVPLRVLLWSGDAFITACQPTRF